MRTHDERVLVARLSAVNADLSRFIVAVIHADHVGPQWPHSAEDEAALALHMVELAGQLEIHAKQLQGKEGTAQPTVVNGADIAHHRVPGTPP